MQCLAPSTSGVQTNPTRCLALVASSWTQGEILEQHQFQPTAGVWTIPPHWLDSQSDLEGRSLKLWRNRVLVMHLVKPDKQKTQPCTELATRPWGRVVCWGHLPPTGRWSWSPCFPGAGWLCRSRWRPSTEASPLSWWCSSPRSWWGGRQWNNLVFLNSVYMLSFATCPDWQSAVSFWYGSFS